MTDVRMPPSPGYFGSYSGTGRGHSSRRPIQEKERYMLGSVASKVAWVGRTASMVFGLALVMALLFGVASTALGANGGSFILGKATNAATNVTGLVGRVAAGEALVVKNPSGGSALGLSVGDPLANPATKTVAPMKVDSQAKVANLNADKIDGKSSEDFANASHPHSGADITSGTVAEARIDAAIARDSEVNTALSGKANTTHQHSGGDITGGTVEADRIEDGAGSNLNADQLDGKDSSSFGIRTEHNYATAHECDTPWSAGQGTNQCAPVTVTVPEGKRYIVSVWSSFSARHSEGFGTFQRVFYCSAGKGPGISTSSPCITPFGVGNYIELDERLSSASSSGESIPLSAGTYTFFTAISPEKAFGFADHGTVITKVMIRDAANGL